MCTLPTAHPIVFLLDKPWGLLVVALVVVLLALLLMAGAGSRPGKGRGDEGGRVKDT